MCVAIPAMAAPKDIGLLHISAAPKSGLEIKRATDLRFGRGPVGAMTYGTTITQKSRDSLDVSFWDSDGDAFLLVTSTKGPGACILDADFNLRGPTLLLFQRDGLACKVVEVSKDVWTIEATGPADRCDWHGTSCEPFLTESSKIHVRVATGSGLELVAAKNLLFGRGMAKSYGADASKNADGSMDFSFSDSDGDFFIAVKPASGSGICILDADAGRGAPTLRVFQRDSLACSPVQVSEGVWEVQSAGPTDQCDWFGSECQPRAPDKLHLSVAKGSGLELLMAKDFIFGRGEAKSYGVDGTKNADGSMDFKFWLSDGDSFVAVKPVTGSGICILDVDADRGSPDVKVFQRDSLPCSPIKVGANDWEIRASGSTEQCDWNGSECAPRAAVATTYSDKLHISVAEGSGLVLDVAKDLLFGRGPVGARSYGADASKQTDGSFDIKFWDSDGDSFLVLKSAQGSGSCILDLDAGRGQSYVKVFQRDTLACEPVQTSKGVWVVQPTGKADQCDWYGQKCTSADSELIV